MESPGTRLGLLAEKGALSTRELDRLAGRPANQAALIIKREQRSIRDDIARSYAEVCGVSPGYLLTGEGVEPTAAHVQAAVERARARATAKPPAQPAPARRGRKTPATRTKTPGPSRARGAPGRTKAAVGES